MSPLAWLKGRAITPYTAQKSDAVKTAGAQQLSPVQNQLFCASNGLVPVKGRACGPIAWVFREPDTTLTSQLCDSSGKSLLKAGVSRDTPLEAQLCLPGLQGAGEINAQRLMQGKPQALAGHCSHEFYREWPLQGQPVLMHILMMPKWGDSSEFKPQFEQQIIMW